MNIKIEQVSFPLKTPFCITGYTFLDTPTVRVTLSVDGVQGVGEAVGIYYRDETVESMTAELEKAARLVSGKTLTKSMVQEILPTGGARNALDCALWDLEAKLSDIRVFERLQMTPKQVKTVFTIGIGSETEMAQKAKASHSFTHLKIKLDDKKPVEKLEAIRAVRPDANIIIDVNQGWSFEELKEYIPACKRLGIAMIEQPLPRGADEQLEGFQSEVLLGADESCLDTSEYAQAARRYDVINIKLDKCGGLTEGLALANLARRDNKLLMIGNMTGSSLSMAPAFVLSQFCNFVDIDGPLLLATDVDNGLQYGLDGTVDIPDPKLWG